MLEGRVFNLYQEVENVLNYRHYLGDELLLLKQRVRFKELDSILRRQLDANQMKGYSYRQMAK